MPSPSGHGSGEVSGGYAGGCNHRGVRSPWRRLPWVQLAPWYVDGYSGSGGGRQSQNRPRSWGQGGGNSSGGVKAFCQNEKCGKCLQANRLAGAGFKCKHGGAERGSASPVDQQSGTYGGYYYNASYARDNRPPCGAIQSLELAAQQAEGPGKHRIEELLNSIAPKPASGGRQPVPSSREALRAAEGAARKAAEERQKSYRHRERLRTELEQAEKRLPGQRSADVSVAEDRIK